MNRSNDEIDDLLIKYLTGQANKDEIREFEVWLNQSSSNKEIYEAIRQSWEEEIDDRVYTDYDIASRADQIWDNSINSPQLVQHIRNQSSYKSLIRYLVGVAASIVLLVIGRSFILTDTSSNDSLVTEQLGSIQHFEEYTALGERKKVMLSDSSLVWLNAGSRLLYTSEYGVIDRNVTLEGEAYFEVRKNTDLVFKVNVYKYTVEVIGTSFNIEGYDEIQNVKVALVEGVVNVKSSEQRSAQRLDLPGEMAVIHRENGRIEKHRYDLESAIGWKLGLLVFDGISFDEFVDKLRRWYNVDINVKGAAPTDWKLRAKYKNETLSNVLKDISFNKGFKYFIKNDQLTITF